MAGGRVVYSTDRGRVCPTCGWPLDDCRCSRNLGKPDAPVPDQPLAKLRLENRASGKHVTVLDGLPENSGFLEALCRDLKKACGTGARRARVRSSCRGTSGSGCASSSRRKESG
jgi:translation initiation factor 1